MRVPLPLRLKARRGDEDGYLAARGEFEGVFGDLARGKRNWQLISFLLAGLLGGSTTRMGRGQRVLVAAHG